MELLSIWCTNWNKWSLCLTSLTSKTSNTTSHNPTEQGKVSLNFSSCNTFVLTRSSPVMTNGYISKCSGPNWSNTPFLFFWRSGTLALKIERQSARMSNNEKGWVRPIWRWTLWWTYFCHSQKRCGTGVLTITFAITKVSHNRRDGRST